ncbi:MAG: hypothetical protein BWY31_00615 [Lentisphaerae bacterium ADurb.Bin242]|nr:MAG: hypothetical protein BWY31_00615 [Lentisphaerae bacterium ADurb.Bin242]
MKPVRLFAAAAAVSAIALVQSACANLCPGCCSSECRPEIVATYTKTPVALDGKLSDPMWQKTPAYELMHSRTAWDKSPSAVRKFFANGVAEPGKVRLLWDDKYLYIGIEFTDSDVVAEAPEDQQHHYLKGDVAEVFLKPMNQTWYWELYATPTGNKTAFFFPGRGVLGLPSGFPEKTLALKNLKTAAAFDGTLNNSWDRDKKWTAEMAVPIAEVGMIGEKLTPEIPWLIFFGRYNYSRYLPVRENSSFPQQESGNYHFYEDYGLLKLVK